jgi:HSP20 family protein
MALIRWEPVAELNSIQNEMNRLFNTFFDQSSQSTRPNSPTRRWIPAMDLVESGDHYVLRADLPGLSDSDVDVQLEDNILTISGRREAEHRHEQEGYYRLERAFGTFSRSLTLPDGIDPESIQAKLDRGVLEVRMPKPEQTKPRTVQINVGGQSDAMTIEGTEAADPVTNSRDPVGAES